MALAVVSGTKKVKEEIEVSDSVTHLLSTIRFLSRMSGGKASIGERMEHDRWGKPALRRGEHPRPVDSVFLAPAANTMPPADQHPMPDRLALFPGTA